MTSWKVINQWNHMGKWNKASFVLLWGWLSLLLFSPYLMESGTTGDLSGVVGKYDNKKVIEVFNHENKYKNKIIFFGIASAIALTIHSIFLGIKFDNDLYKLFRRVVMLLFIIFEIAAQAYLVTTLYSFKDKLKNFINLTFLKIKLFLILILIIVAVISIPIISLPGDYFLDINLKFLKHALEWDYFLGVISFYLLTFLMWKKN